MSIQTPLTPSPETQTMLDCLRQAVANTLKRKRRLEQYAVLWSGGGPIAVGEDAPVQLKNAQKLFNSMFKFLNFLHSDAYKITQQLGTVAKPSVSMWPKSLPTLCLPEGIN